MITTIALGLAVVYCYFLTFAMDTPNLLSTTLFKFIPFTVATICLVALVVKHFDFLLALV